MRIPITTCFVPERLCYPIFVGECILNEDCDLGWFCVQGVCTDADDVVPCTDDGDCQAAERCDRLNLVCVQDLGCNRDEDCAVGEVCNKATQRLRPGVRRIRPLRGVFRRRSVRGGSELQPGDQPVRGRELLPDRPGLPAGDHLQPPDPAVHQRPARLPGQR